MKAYRKHQWHEFREEVIKLDGGKCSQCQRSRNDGVVLQVHHKRYIQGFMPWEYPVDLCETLCSGCHAKEHGIVRPSHGWEHIGYEDLGSLSGECDLCGQSIRHVFLVIHNRWIPMEVGEVCCEAITGTPEASEHRKHLERRKRFISSSRWHQTGEQRWTINQDQIPITCLFNGSHYQLEIQGKRGNLSFNSANEARATAFDLIHSGKLKEWVERQGFGRRRSKK